MASRSSSVIQQHETHRQLVGYARPPVSRWAPPDAIVVPASRQAANLGQAVALAQAVNCRLVVFCSRQAKAAEVMERVAVTGFRRAVVADLPGGYTHEYLRFRSSGLVREASPGIAENPNGDLSIKRNLGLLLARMLGWQRIFFMDDDIRDVTPADLYATVAMLSGYRSAGMMVTDFPDNSVVCHAHRETGGSAGHLRQRLGAGRQYPGQKPDSSPRSTMRTGSSSMTMRAHGDSAGRARTRRSCPMTLLTSQSGPNGKSLAMSWPRASTHFSMRVPGKHRQITITGGFSLMPAGDFSKTSSIVTGGQRRTSR